MFLAHKSRTFSSVCFFARLFKNILILQKKNSLRETASIVQLEILECTKSSTVFNIAVCKQLALFQVLSCGHVTAAMLWILCGSTTLSFCKTIKR